MPPARAAQARKPFRHSQRTELDPPYAQDEARGTHAQQNSTNSQHHLAPTYSTYAWRPCRPLDSPQRGTPRGSVPMLQRFTARRLDRSGTHVVCPLPRKEVIQPQLPLRLPCYDFVPITSPALDGCLLGEPRLAPRLQALPAFVT